MASEEEQMAVPSCTRGPKRCIYTERDLTKFLESPAKQELLKLITAMGKSCAAANTVQYDPNDALIGLSPAMAAVHGSLTQMKTWMADFPPDANAHARFGNPSFRKWHGRLVERSSSIVYSILKQNQEYPGAQQDYAMDVLTAASQKGMEAAQVKLDLDTIESTEDRAIITELSAYLHDAFGHPIRLDYGTGHESSFQVFLYVLCRLGCFGSSQTEPPSAERLKAITLSLYSAYLAVTRQVQTDYMLEPAGSHGVWGLDDYHCLPFYFGACQMQSLGVEEEEYTPASIHDESVLERKSDEFMFFGCIQYIKSLKKGAPFFESSPMLNDISHMSGWSKVSSGLLRLYEGEVLKKRPVVQHFVFGKVFAANWEPSEAPRAPPVNVTFRGGPVPSARAPWAASGSLPVARAPWAKDGTAGPMPPTKAPWAK
jgi:hypothetical protein